MIKFKKIEIKNLMSVGNRPITLELDGYKKTLITGKNGTGKSTILVEGLTFALYGKAYRDINKPLLVNSFNGKGLLVNLFFEIGQTQYEIKRGIGPGVFQTFKDGVLIPEDASIGDYQTYLEKTILNMSYKTFKQLVVLGTAGFTPFMQLKTGDRRSVVEDLLNLHMFGKMTTDNKEMMAAIQNEITQIEHDIDLVTQKYQLLSKSQADSKEQADIRIANLRKALDDLNQSVGASKLKISSYSDSIVKLEGALSNESYQSKINQLSIQIGNLNAMIGQANKMRTFLTEHSTCPVCTQEIDQKFRDDKIFSITMEIDGYGLEKKDATDDCESYRKIESRDQMIHGKVSELKQKLAYEKANVAQMEKRIDEIKLEIDRIEQKEFKDYTDVLVKISNKIDQLKHRKDELVNDKYCHSVTAAILKDTGVKSVVINQYIPVINSLINHYLVKFRAPYTFELDSEFNEIVKTRGMEKFTYHSFSEGQKYRIDLAILFAWRAMIKHRTGTSLNLMVMDEVMDSSADTDGIEALVEILDQIDQSVYIISHNEKLDSMEFDRKIDVKLVGRFSEIQISV